ncbi:hypothetical protein JCM15765_17230 [Paradesulfitobacterium aromaticivorans]
MSHPDDILQELSRARLNEEAVAVERTTLIEVGLRHPRSSP